MPVNRKPLISHLVDNLATAACMIAALWHGMLHGRYDAASFYVLVAILAQLPPRSTWRK